MTAKEDLRQKLYMMMIRNGINDVSMEIDAILGEYEVQDRTMQFVLILVEQTVTSWLILSSKPDIFSTFLQCDMYFLIPGWK